MFIRQTKTRDKSTTGSYFTYRLVTSERIGKQVRQNTLLNLGRNFDLPREDWPRLCSRIERLLSGQTSLLPESENIEKLAQRYFVRLGVVHPVTACDRSEEHSETVTYSEVAVETLNLSRPRSVGVEHVGLAAMSWLGLDKLLDDVGLNAVQRAAVCGSIIGRMASPSSEGSTFRWLTERSALGELLKVDFEAMPMMRLYRASDLLVRNREEIEQAVFSRVSELFALETTITLYDLTNTYFEGNVTGNDKAVYGRSKEKRSDCPLVTLGLVLDGSGFIRRSKMFACNVVEGTTLEEMLTGLSAPAGAMVVMDRGIATETNIGWLKKNGYRYLVASRERERQFDADLSVETLTSAGETMKLQRVLSEDGQEVRLYCYSEGREKKEAGINERFATHFEAGLARLADGLSRPRGVKKMIKIMERIGRLKEKSHGIGSHYTISAIPDKTGKNVISLIWQKSPLDGSRLTHPGVYCLRSNETAWDEKTLWHNYIMLSDLEAVFRSMKSELGLRPVFHHKEERTEGHLFITVLAYQLVQIIRKRLKIKEIHISWNRLREILSVQQRVTASFRQRDNKTLHIRKATMAEPDLLKIYQALEIAAAPGGVMKIIA